MDIPVVYLTAFGDKEIVQRAKTTDAFGYIVKPFTAVTLKEKIDKIFERLEATAG